MCPPPLIMSGLKFLAPIILPQLVQSVFGGDRNKGPSVPDTHAAGLAQKTVKQAIGGEDVDVKKEDTPSEIEATMQRKNAKLRAMLGTKNLDKKEAPGSDVVGAPVAGATDTQSGLNLGQGNAAPAGSY